MTCDNFVRNITTKYEHLIGNNFEISSTPLI